MIDLSVIIPVFNESAVVGNFLTELGEEMRNWHVKSEILVINDGSTDGTDEIVRSFYKHGLPGHLTDFPTNKGKGAAVTAGVKAALGKKLVIIDGDGAFAPTLIIQFYEALEVYHAALGVKKGGSFFRSALSYSFNYISRILFHLPTPDALCGIKGFRGELAKFLFSYVTDSYWLYDLEILQHIKPVHRVKCIEITVRENPNSKFRLHDPFVMLCYMFAMRLRR